jgi:ketosteroid isomerase-like protein
MRSLAGSLTAIGLLLLSGCDRPTDIFGEPVDLDAARVELMETDMAWSQAAAAMDDPALVASYWSDDAMVMGAGSPTVSGKAAILDMVETSAAIPGFRIEWEAEGVDVGPGGRMGYTWGRNAITVANPDGGPPIVTAGRYLTVWRKNLDGEWKCVMDMWTDDPSDAPMPPA